VCLLQHRLRDFLSVFPISIVLHTQSGSPCAFSASCTVCGHDQRYAFGQGRDRSLATALSVIKTSDFKHSLVLANDASVTINGDTSVSGDITLAGSITAGAYYDQNGNPLIQKDTTTGAVRLTSSSISIHLTALFYEITKERHSVRAASRFSLNVLRFESDLCELNRL